MTFFRHVFFKQPPKLTQKSINGKRHYCDPLGKVLDKGILLPSVTTVLSGLSEVGIDAWKARVGEVEADRVSTRALANGKSKVIGYSDALTAKVSISVPGAGYS